MVEPSRHVRAVHRPVPLRQWARRLATAHVYQNVSRSALTSEQHSASLILDFLAQGDSAGVCSSLFNRLGEVAALLAPEVAAAKESLARESSQRAIVSGSGTAVYAMLGSADRAARVAARMRICGAGQMFVAATESTEAALG